MARIVPFNLSTIAESLAILKLLAPEESASLILPRISAATSIINEVAAAALTRYRRTL